MSASVPSTFGPWSAAGVAIDPDQQMQADIDQHATEHAAAVAGAGAAGSGGAVPPGLPTEPPSMMSILQTMQQMMQVMMSFQNGQGTTSSGTLPPAAVSPQGGVCWQRDGHMANVRLGERAFRRLDKFSNKKSDWKEWRTQLLTAIRECDTTFATTLVHHERSEEVIKNENLTPTLQQLSATLQARLVSVTAKEAFAIVDAEQGEGIEAWRQLVKRFDPRRTEPSRLS